MNRSLTSLIRQRDLITLVSLTLMLCFLGCDAATSPPDRSSAIDESRGHDHSSSAVAFKDGRALVGALLPGGGYGTVARKGGLKAFQVGRFDDLKRLSAVGDDLALHHAGQKHPMGQIIRNYDEMAAPSIAIPTAQHRAIPNLRGPFNGSARDLLARDIAISATSQMRRTVAFLS